MVKYLYFAFDPFCPPNIYILRLTLFEQPSPNGINSRLWVSVCIALGILSAGSPTEAAIFTFQSGDFFAFDTGTVSNSSSGSQIRLLFNEAVEGSTGVGATSSHSFVGGEFYSFTLDTTGGFEIDSAERHIRWTTSGPDLYMQNQGSGGGVNLGLGTTDFDSVTFVDPGSITQTFSRTVTSQPSDVYAFKIGSDVFKLQVENFSASEFDVSGSVQVAQINLPVVPASDANVLVQTLGSGSATHAFLTGTTDFASVTAYDPDLVDSTFNRSFESNPFEVMVFKDGEDLYKFQLVALPDEFSSGSFQVEAVSAVPEPSAVTLVFGMTALTFALCRRRNKPAAASRL